MQPPYREPWTVRSGTSGWILGNDDPSQPAERVFKFDNLTGAGELYYNDEANVRPSRPNAFNDWLAYDAEDSRRGGNWHLVGDLKLQFFYDRKAGDGPLRVLLSKRDKGFIAEIDGSTARLLVAGIDGKARELIAATQFRADPGPIFVEFANVDYQVTLRINGREVFQSTPEQYAPDVRDLLANPVASQIPQVRIMAERQQATLSHISLWRDIYSLGDNNSWRGNPDNLVHLGPDEFFTLGDNSQISGDGRFWSEPTVLPYEGVNVEAGKVPARFMLGKAFFVYWPAGYRPFETQTVPALVPNFGDMRFIH
jgi:hypothetical protein